MLDEKRLQELRTMPYQAYLQTPEWQAKRDQALDKAGHRCQLCNSNDSLNVHHRTYERRGNEELSDLTVLCRACHSLFHDRVPTEEQEYTFHPLSDIVQEFRERLDTHVSEGMSTGYKIIDYALGGFQKSDLILLGGRTGLGKTSFALNIALNTALAGNSVAIFSLEMTKQQLFNRLLAIHSSIDGQSIHLGYLCDDDQNTVLNSTNALADLPIWISDEIATVDSMRHQLRKLIASSKKVDLVIIDYIRLIEPDKHTKRLNAEQQIRAISRALKLLAKEFNIPVLVLCQLSREVEKRIDKQPQLSDLRDSGTLEEDADVVMLMCTDNDASYTDNTIMIDIIVAKNRKGPVGTTTLCFENSTTSFRDI